MLDCCYFCFKKTNVKKTASQRKTFHKDSYQACRHLAKKNANKGYSQQSNYQKQALAKQTTCSQRRQHFYQDEKYFSALEDRKYYRMPKVISSDSETEYLPKDDMFGELFLKQKEKQEQYEERGECFLVLNKHGNSERKNVLSANSEIGSTEATKEDKDQICIVEEESVAVSHTIENSQSITEAKTIQTLTSHIKEILLYFLPECNISREHITSMCPEDVLSVFSFKRHWDQNKTAMLWINQYFSQYEGQLSKKLQCEGEFQKVHDIETEMNQCKEQIKATEEKLAHLRRKIALLLLRIHPHLVINNLEHVDTILEECLNQETGHPLVPVKTNTTEISASTFPDEENRKIFNTL